MKINQWICEHFGHKFRFDLWSSTRKGLVPLFTCERCGKEGTDKDAFK